MEVKALGVLNPVSKAACVTISSIPRCLNRLVQRVRIQDTVSERLG